MVDKIRLQENIRKRRNKDAKNRLKLKRQMNRSFGVGMDIRHQISAIESNHKLMLKQKVINNKLEQRKQRLKHKQR